MLGTIESLGNNLDDGSCDFDQPSDIVGENPRIGALRGNGNWGGRARAEATVRAGARTGARTRAAGT